MPEAAFQKRKDVYREVGEYCHQHSEGTSLMNKASFGKVDSRYLFLLLVPFAFVFRAIPYRLKIGRNSHKQLEKFSDVLDSKTIASRIVGYLSRIEEKFDQYRLIPYGLSIYSVYRPKDSGLIEDDIS